ncbi:hypothetical protein ROA7450_01556 [Roseovarius albus]|uniref:Uncharacterized protein n=1 Tax=Roseovarius albus TaxID=1247867 RepID=A0A1X6YXC4_9RHOB|nr:hypothetical protein [Roseovarius albus]SLN34502.1 hypothetical protein ROA7450_01556 [Roseovarius albus]
MTEFKPLQSGAWDLAQGTNHRESADGYHSVILRGDLYRVIACKDHLQWIIQRRAGVRHGGVRWDSFAYCRTRDALIRRWTGLHVDGSTDWPSLERLPAQIGRS